MTKLYNRHFLPCISLLSLVLFFIGCNIDQKDNYSKNANKTGTKDSTPLHTVLEKVNGRTTNGELLFKKNCAVCHMSPTKECRPDLRSFFRKQSYDSMTSIIAFISDSKNANGGGHIFQEEKDKDEFLKNYQHKFNDNLTRVEIEDIVLYSWILSLQ